MTQDEGRALRSARPTKTSTAHGPESAVSVTDAVRRRLYWHNVFRRHRRWSRELDLLLRVDPWAYTVPVDDVHRDGSLDLPARQYRGRELFAARWTP